MRFVDISDEWGLFVPFQDGLLKCVHIQSQRRICLIPVSMSDFGHSQGQVLYRNFTFVPSVAFGSKSNLSCRDDHLDVQIA